MKKRKEIILNPATPTTHPIIALGRSGKGIVGIFVETLRLSFSSQRQKQCLSRHTKEERIHHQQTCTRRIVRSSLHRRKMIVSENLDLHKRMKSTRSGNSMREYKGDFLVIQNSLKDNQLFVWPKSSFRIFHKMLQKNPNELFGHPNT